MKSLGLLIALSLAHALHGQVVKDPVAPNPVRVSTRLQLVLELQQPKVKSGERVGARTTYENISPSAIDVGSGDWTLDYAVTVTDELGRECPRTALGERWLNEQREPVLLRSEGPVHLEQGTEGKEISMDLAKIYQLTKPGVYFVRFLYRSIWPDPGESRPTSVEDAQRVPIEEAVSNVVQFEITP